jgi:cell division protein FtsA
VRVVVSEFAKGKKNPAILAMVQKESRGLRHGYIVNVEDAAASIKEAVREAERIAKTRLRSAFVSVGGVSLSSSYTEGSIAVSRADSEISDLDVKRVIAASEANLKDVLNRRILHIVPLQYKLDGKKILGRPVGFKGGILDVRTLFITCLEQHIEDLIAAVEASGIEIEDVIASPIAESYVVLSRLQRNAGCVMANIGAETVSVVVFEEGIPISLQIFPIGSTDITNDIALGLKIPLEEAESIKKTREGGSMKRKIDEIIEARLSDIFDLIEAHLKKIGKNGLLPAGIILTGGGSVIEAIEELAKGTLRLPARVIVPRDIKDPAWSVAYGLCVLGLDPESEESLGIKIAKRTTSGILYWMKQLLP